LPKHFYHFVHFAQFAKDSGWYSIKDAVKHCGDNFDDLDPEVQAMYEDFVEVLEEFAEAYNA
jgi:hypothetical protein